MPILIVVISLQTIALAVASLSGLEFLDASAVLRAAFGCLAFDSLALFVEIAIGPKRAREALRRLDETVMRVAFLTASIAFFVLLLLPSTSGPTIAVLLVGLALLTPTCLAKAGRFSD